MIANSDKNNKKFNSVIRRNLIFFDCTLFFICKCDSQIHQILLPGAHALQNFLTGGGKTFMFLLL